MRILALLLLSFSVNSFAEEKFSCVLTAGEFKREISNFLWPEKVCALYNEAGKVIKLENSISCSSLEIRLEKNHTLKQGTLGLYHSNAPYSGLEFFYKNSDGFENRMDITVWCSK
jgi:hypothetical protein